MNRYAFLIEYDGTPFCGWQKQESSHSVQQALEEAFYCLTKESMVLQGAGRTDTGVHALGQVAHGDCQGTYIPHRLVGGLNFYLKQAKHPIAVLGAALVEQDFHARFSATKRSYRYWILNRLGPTVLAPHRTWQVRHPLDIEKMQQGASYFLGTHNFKNFRASDCQSNTPIKTIEHSTIFRVNEHLICYEVAARSFLHNQVRRMVGTLKIIGLGKKEPQWILQLLDPQHPKKSPLSAPPDGLFLSHITYGTNLFNGEPRLL
jgi:tRNA pseudouridine38-40 synthase